MQKKEKKKEEKCWWWMEKEKFTWQLKMFWMVRVRIRSISILFKVCFLQGKKNMVSIFSPQRVHTNSTFNKELLTYLSYRRLRGVHTWIKQYCFWWISKKFDINIFSVRMFATQTITNPVLSFPEASNRHQRTCSCRLDLHISEETSWTNPRCRRVVFINNHGMLCIDWIIFSGL